MSDVRPHRFPTSARLPGGPAWLGHAPAAAVPFSFPGTGASISTEPESLERISGIPIGEPGAAAPAVIPPDHPRLVAFARAAVDLGAARVLAIAHLEGQLLELSVAIASSIIDREIEVDPTVHGALARAALATLGNAPGARLRASREAYAAIVDVFGAPAVTLDGVTVQVTADPSIEGLGCVAENEHTRVDGRVGERLRAVLRSLEDERRRTEETE